MILFIKVEVQKYNIECHATQKVFKAWDFMMRLNFFGCGSTNGEMLPTAVLTQLLIAFWIFSPPQNVIYTLSSPCLHSFHCFMNCSLYKVLSLSLHLWKTLSRYQSLKPAGFPNPQIKTIVIYMALSSVSFGDSLL